MKNLVFLPGFNMKSKHYSEHLDFFSGFFNLWYVDMTSFSPKPCTVDEYTEEVGNVLEHYKLKDYGIIGHSLGGGVGWNLASKTDNAKRLVGFNPLMPIDYDELETVCRGFKCGLKEITKGNLLFPVSYLSRALTHPLANWNLIKDIQNFSYEDNPVVIPTRIYLCDNDEFFKESCLGDEKYRSNLELISLEGNHLNCKEHKTSLWLSVTNYLRS